ncbi:MAG: sigma-70 domain-containing protein [Lachnospiraceae bacterium]|nr:sigma-70 domain-containing protein [Lachnospiraceae bacterium]
MDHKIIFREMLSEIKKAADAAGDVISKAEIKEILGNLPLEEEHFELIYSYLAEQHIRVVESKEEAQELPEQEGENSLSLYIEELMKLKGEIPEDEQRLMRQAMQGDEAARLHLIESYLPLICEMAGGYEGTEVSAEDLIQEGNLGLLTAMESIGRLESPAACRAHIINSINAAMEAAIGSSRETKKMDEGIVSRVNHLNEAVRNLERDLEHKVSAEELSAYLEMPLEEIRDILRMSGDQIEVEKNE